MKLKSKIRSILSQIFPSTPSEFILFFLFLTSYGILGSIIAWNYRIIFDDRIPWDAYFSFDNRAIVLTGGGFERHPLSNYFFDFIRNSALYISDGKKDEVFRLILAWYSNIFISLSLVQIYKYLRNIIILPMKFSLLLVLFFALFSTNIILSFTPETYTYSLFALCLFNYYSARKIKNGKTLSTSALTISSIAIGGLTITNIVKVYIPLLFEKHVFKNWKKFGSTAFKTIISAGIFILLFLYRLDFNLFRIINKTGEQYDKFTNPKAIYSLKEMIFSWFLGGNILFSNFIVKDYHNKQGFEYKALFMDTYNSVFPYIFVVILLGLIFWSYIKNFKNPLVQILIISFSVDIIIHCILKFGIWVGYIYGGHFVFIFPLLLGWLLHAYKKSSKILTCITFIICFLFLYLTLNNLYRMSEFFNFLEEFYR